LRPNLTILIIFSLTLSYAQIRPPLTIPKTVKVDFGNQKKDKQYKKAVKDSLQSAKKRYKALQRQAKLSEDSLTNEAKRVLEDSLNRLKREYMSYDSSYLEQYRNQLPDSPKDSLRLPSGQASYLNQYKDQIPDSTTITN
jgi:hypothetical protein